MIRILMTMAAIAPALCSCANSNVSPGLARGDAAYGAMSAEQPAAMAQGYRIGALDTLDIAVFQEPDLSAKAIQVDAAGNISLPLIGSIRATGKTASELAGDIGDRLGARYLTHPQVSVAVASSVSQRVTVQGQVTEPGVYPIQGPTSLMEAIALAKGETRTAALGEVVVFRTVGGRRMGAVFDLKAIRRGSAPDPVIRGNDQIVVGFSAAKSMWRDVLSTAPLLNVFRPVGY